MGTERWKLLKEIATKLRNNESRITIMSWVDEEMEKEFGTINIEKAIARARVGTIFSTEEGKATYTLKLESDHEDYKSIGVYKGSVKVYDFILSATISTDEGMCKCKLRILKYNYPGVEASRYVLHEVEVHRSISSTAALEEIMRMFLTKERFDARR